MRWPPPLDLIDSKGPSPEYRAESRITRGRNMASTGRAANLRPHLGRLVVTAMVAAVVAGSLFIAVPDVMRPCDVRADAVMLTPPPSPVAIAFVQPVNGDRSPNRGELRLFDSRDSSTRTIGPADGYSDVRWSPNGRSLAAIASGLTPRDTATRLYLFRPATGSLQTIPLGDSAYARRPVWSPDGAALAVLGSKVLLFSAEGTKLYESPALQPPNQPPGVISSAVNGYGWSPDQQRFAAFVNGTPVVVERSGVGKIASLNSLSGGSSSTPDYLLGWQGTGRVLMASAEPGDLQRWSVSVDGAALVSQIASPGSERAQPAARREAVPIDSATQAEFDRILPNHIVIEAMWSADGSASFYLLRPGPSSPGAVSGKPAQPGPSSGVSAGTPVSGTPVPVPSNPPLPPGVSRQASNAPSVISVPVTGPIVVVRYGNAFGSIKLPDPVTNAPPFRWLVDVVVNPALSTP